MALPLAGERGVVAQAATQIGDRDGALVLQQACLRRLQRPHQLCQPVAYPFRIGLSEGNPHALGVALGPHQQTVVVEPRLSQRERPLLPMPSDPVVGAPEHGQDAGHSIGNGQSSRSARSHTGSGARTLLALNQYGEK